MSTATSIHRVRGVRADAKFYPGEDPFTAVALRFDVPGEYQAVAFVNGDDHTAVARLLDILIEDLLAARRQALARALGYTPGVADVPAPAEAVQA